MKKTRYIPYGYTIKDGKTTIEQSEAGVIQTIFHRYIDGSSLQEIADELTANKIPYTEKTTVWDKARISRIIANSKYLGTGEYESIIDERTYASAAECKAHRLRNIPTEHFEYIKQILHSVRCDKCGCPMKRKVSSRGRIKESWTCTNEACKMRVKITDGMLLEKIGILLNRIAENHSLLTPIPRTQEDDESPSLQLLLNQINTELSHSNPNEDIVINLIIEVAQEKYKSLNIGTLETNSLLYRQSNKTHSKTAFDIDYFNELISYITITEDGYITLHTKTEAQIEEERIKNE